MVSTHKAESENKEIQDKVRARAVVMTDPGEEMAELGQQIAKLMVCLTKAGQGNLPLVHQVAPGKGAIGEATMVVVPPVAQIPIMVGVAPDR